ncbi:MAG: hypothetical protein GF398_04770 [Chitinivibrionales bacterium]|nr:hypothetical protein [Chitinivibrionales bacterium]
MWIIVWQQRAPSREATYISRAAVTPKTGSAPPESTGTPQIESHNDALPASLHTSVDSTGDTTSAPHTSSNPARQCVNVNTATAGRLEALKGIGPAKAQRIIAHRQEHGPFAHPDDLMDVKGIGPATVAKNKSRICF